MGSGTSTAIAQQARRFILTTLIDSTHGCNAAALGCATGWTTWPRILSIIQLASEDKALYPDSTPASDSRKDWAWLGHDSQEAASIPGGSSFTSAATGDG